MLAFELNSWNWHVRLIWFHVWYYRNTDIVTYFGIFNIHVKLHSSIWKDIFISITNLSSIFKALKYLEIEKSEAAKKLIWISNFYPLPITLFILCCYSQVPLDLFSYDDLLWMLRIVWQFDATNLKFLGGWNKWNFLPTLQKSFSFLSASKYTNKIYI